MTDPVSLIDGYIAIWNAVDAEERRALIAGAWAESGRYIAP